MGLVTTTTPVSINSLVSTVLYIHTPIKVCTDGSSSSSLDSTVMFDKTLYRLFSMQSDMKTLVFDGVVSNEFEEFLKYGTDLTNSIGSVKAVDTYLGTLGGTNGVC